LKRLSGGSGLGESFRGTCEAFGKLGMNGPVDWRAAIRAITGISTTRVITPWIYF